MHPSHEKEAMLMLKMWRMKWMQCGLPARCILFVQLLEDKEEKRVHPPSRPTDMSGLLELHLHLEKERKNSRRLPSSSHMDSLNMYHWVKKK